MRLQESDPKLILVERYTLRAFFKMNILQLFAARNAQSRNLRVDFLKMYLPQWPA